MKNLPGWNFSDWVYGPTWQQGMALRGADGNSSLMDFQLLYGYQKMSELEHMFGHQELGQMYAQRALQLKEAIQQNYWSAERGLYSDRKEFLVYFTLENSFHSVFIVLDSVNLMLLF